MRRTHIFSFIFFGLTSAIALTVNEINVTQADSNALGTCNGSDCPNLNARKGRHIQKFIGIVPPNEKIKKQVIKIPPSVSKVKIVRPPLNLRRNRAPQKFVRHPSNFRSSTALSPYHKPQMENDFEVDSSFLHDSKKIKRHFKKPIVREVSPEEFYKDEAEEEFLEEKQKPKTVKKYRLVKKKKPMQNILSEYLTDFEGDTRPNPGEGGGSHSFKLRNVPTEESHPFYGYDSAESNIYTKQIQPPNVFPEDSPDTSMDELFQQFYQDKNYVPALKIKKLPSKGRQIQSIFSQQYTTHNPSVTTNFGLSETFQPKGLHYGMKASLVDMTPYKVPQSVKYSQPIADASELVVTTLPVKTTGMQVIQPPQFRDVLTSHPSYPSKLVSQQDETSKAQKATIRDILDQDCPVYDVKGYCSSPPRYPTQQIKNIVRKCTDLMDAMNTQPSEESQDVYSFARNIDNHPDRSNKSISVNLGLIKPASWSRSAADEFTACYSDVELTEPGYAKEVNSGKWFVIVQHPDTAIQRIATDTCKNPGKQCGGLSELKCVKINSLSGKSSRCVQRYTNQKLISWDPESPEDCPRMRVFRFPSACICHLNIT